jgi:hypothetical protein
MAVLDSRLRPEYLHHNAADFRGHNYEQGKTDTRWCPGGYADVGVPRRGGGD